MSREAERRYKASAKGIATRRANAAREDFKQRRREARRRYNATEKGRARNAELRKRHDRRHPERTRARSRVRAAVRSGQLVKPAACEDCGRAACLQGHHHHGYDEAHWYDVRWLCRQCHRDADNAIAA